MKITHLMMFAGGFFLTAALTQCGKPTYGDQRITDSRGRTQGYVSDSGRISTPDGKTAGYLTEDGRITDRAGRTQGYIESDRRHLSNETKKEKR